MKISVIVAYYKNLSFLEMVLKGLERQSTRDFEVIIAEDDHNPETGTYLQEYRTKSSLELVHADREKKEGFRKTQMLNRAIRKARGEILVFLDGDCIPHRHHLRSYLERIRPGEFHYGRRVMLGPGISGRILNSRSLRPLRFLQLLFSDSRNKKEGIYTRWFPLHLSQRKLSGCNWGISREDILKVNGFDEDYIRPGVGEDFDIEWRLKAAGLAMRSIRNRANVYHLFHQKSSDRREDGRVNEAIMERKIQQGEIRCVNGLETL